MTSNTSWCKVQKLKGQKINSQYRNRRNQTNIAKIPRIYRIKREEEETEKHRRWSLVPGRREKYTNNLEGRFMSCYTICWHCNVRHNDGKTSIILVITCHVFYEIWNYLFEVQHFKTKQGCSCIGILFKITIALELRTRTDKILSSYETCKLIYIKTLQHVKRYVVFALMQTIRIGRLLLALFGDLRKKLSQRSYS